NKTGRSARFFVQFFLPQNPAKTFPQNIMRHGPFDATETYKLTLYYIFDFLSAIPLASLAEFCNRRKPL
ncbi:hypothetical protein, partial [Serratia bockelmannii]|uniref:hypothetical protein n=1 Tax=Serratia bockelmannii TaxID=2703793 RepID=UPI00384BF186